MSRRVSWPHNNASLNTSFLVYRVTCNTITITSASDRSLSLKVRSHRLRRAAQCRMAPQRNAHQRTAAQLIRCERTFSSCSGLRISWARESPVARMTLVFYGILRRHLDYDTLYTLIRALILSRLDYCNSLFANSSQSTLHRLQRVQDAAARPICGASARTHALPLLKQLHWLPVSSRIQFKLCTLMFDINHGTASQYLSELVRRCDDTRLRSSARGNFVVSRTRLHVTDKAFSIAGPRAWNALPSDIKLISSRTSFLKTQTQDTILQPFIVVTFY